MHSRRVPEASETENAGHQIIQRRKMQDTKYNNGQNIYESLFVVYFLWNFYILASTREPPGRSTRKTHKTKNRLIETMQITRRIVRKHYCPIVVPDSPGH